jgi:hypothetical protein
MGGAGSTPMTPAEREAARRRRQQRAEAKLKKKQSKQAKKDALQREKDAWLRNYRARLEKKWWNAGWWPIYERWKENSAWDQEMQWRKKEGLLNSDGVPLRIHHD